MLFIYPLANFCIRLLLFTSGRKITLTISPYFVACFVHNCLLTVGNYLLCFTDFSFSTLLIFHFFLQLKILTVSDVSKSVTIIIGNTSNLVHYPVWDNCDAVKELLIIFTESWLLKSLFTCSILNLEQPEQNAIEI